MNSIYIKIRIFYEIKMPIIKLERDKIYKLKLLKFKLQFRYTYYFKKDYSFTTS